MRPHIVNCPIPVIAISPPPFECPESPPLTEVSSIHSSVDDIELYRPAFLTPPPTIISKPIQFKPQAKGLEPIRFESLLQASRGRSAAAKQQVDLRKEVTLKAHSKKQDERRARFLAKIGAPPSPSAIHLPVTPPESPALFHFTLPSPGLVSPLALFESLGSEAEPKKSTTTTWVEQVKFSLPRDEDKSLARRGVLEMRRRSLPSLEDISSHFRVNAPSTTTRSRPPLPAFLYARKSPPSSITPMDPIVAHNLEPHSPIPSYRGGIVQTASMSIPHRSSSSPTALTEANLIAFDRRLRATIGLTTLKRRLPPVQDYKLASLEDKRERRFSAPSQFPSVRAASLPVLGGF